MLLRIFIFVSVSVLKELIAELNKKNVRVQKDHLSECLSVTVEDATQLVMIQTMKKNLRKNCGELHYVAIKRLYNFNIVTPKVKTINQMISCTAIR